MNSPRVSTRTLTTAHLSAAHPFHLGRTLDHHGLLIGREVIAGRPFSCDPWRLYADGLVTSPGMVIAGQVGLGKSALVKTYLARQAATGRRCVVIDPKGEYDRLAEWFGTTPVCLRPGGPTRLNPLDNAIGTDRQFALVATLLESGLGRRLDPIERAACERACVAARTRGRATLAGVHDALRDPSADDAARLDTTPDRLRTDTRSCALELRRLCEGDLAGMLDDHTTPDVRLDSSVVVFDLRALRHSAALALVMACIAAWHEGHVAHDPVPGILVIDEAWALVANTATAEFLQRSWKLARAAGVQNILVVHRISDLSAAGDTGSRVAQIAEGLVSESEICVLLRQAHADIAHTRSRLGLSRTEAELVTRLPRGCALWRIGGRSFVVAHTISDAERTLIDTDQAMRATADHAPAEP